MSRFCQLVRKRASLCIKLVKQKWRIEQNKIVAHIFQIYYIKQMIITINIYLKHVYSTHQTSIYFTKLTNGQFISNLSIYSYKNLTKFLSGILLIVNALIYFDP